MRTITKYIISICLAACTVFLAMSCSSNDDVKAEAGGNDGCKTLVLHIGTVGQSRASDSAIELMHSLRVIILDNNGQVEHNFHTSFDSGVLEYTHQILNLPAGQKTIHLIANEESVQYIDEQAGCLTESSLHDFLGAIKIGDTDAGGKIDDIHFKPDYTKNIPISARHNIYIPLNSTEMERTLYMVRVATKFTVNFVNYRDDEVKVNDFTISSVADQNYLMARVGENGGLFNGYPSWIDWLKNVSDISQENPYDPDLADQYGWVKEYDLPADANTGITYRYSNEKNSASPIIVPSYNEAVGEMKVDDIYIPESMCLKAEKPKYGEQEYKMTFDIEDGPNKELSYPLPNLKALFRNTHVLVTVRMNRTPPGGDNFLEVRVRTWEPGDKVNGGWEEVTD